LKKKLTSKASEKGGYLFVTYSFNLWKK